MPGRAVAIVALLSLNASMALAAGIWYRFRPGLRGAEPPSAILSFLLWIVCLVLYNAPTREPTFPVMMEAHSPSEFNSNFFYSLWATGGLSMYLVADLLAGNRRSGLVLQSAGDLARRRPTERYEIAATRTWIVLFLSSTLLLSFAAARRHGPSCEGPYLSGSPYCASASASISVGIVGAALCLVRRAARLFVRGEGGGGDAIETALGLSVLLAHACGAGLVTSPGGAGSDACNVYVTSWMCLATSMVLNVNRLGWRLASPLRDENGRIATPWKDKELGTLRKSSLEDEGTSSGEDEDDLVVDNGDDDGWMLQYARSSASFSTEMSKSNRSRIV